MSHAASAIDEIQMILSKPEWDGGTIELVGQALQRHGFDSWAKNTVRENQYLKQRLVEDVANGIEFAVDQWSVDQLGAEVTRYMILGWATTIVTTIIDLNTEEQ